MDNQVITTSKSPKKSNKIFLFCLLAVIIMNLGLGVFFLYQNAGLKYFIKADSKIQKLSEPNKSKAVAIFYGESGNAREYRGILAGINKNGSGGIWIWGKSGLKYFYADKDSVYQFTNGCIDSIINPDPELIIEGEQKKIESEVYTDLGKWSQRVNVGDFVIVLSRSDIGFLKGNLGNVFGHNWWYFLQSDMKTECEK